jgi:hypothetical protein
LASVLVNPKTPCFDITYGETLLIARLPATDATLRIVPLVLSGSPVLDRRQFHGQMRCSPLDGVIAVPQKHNIWPG